MERRTILKALLVFLFYTNLNAQEKVLEQKALDYFCDNINQIKQGIIDYNIKFSGKTKGQASDVFDIADCIGNISLIKNEIPNNDFLDSIYNANNKLEIETMPLNYNINFLKKFTINKRSYVLSVFDAIIYDGAYYVELYLVNKKRSSWVFCVEFDIDKKEPIDHCIKFIAF